MQSIRRRTFAVEHYGDHWSKEAEELRSLSKRIMEGVHPVAEKVLQSLPLPWQGVLGLAHAELPGFATLDPDLVDSIIDLRSAAAYYIRDASLRRPCNILMVAQAGSGKSHFVQCLGKRLDAPVVTANLATTEAIDAL